MSTESKEVSISDHKFEFFALNGEQGALWGYRVMKGIAPSLAALFGKKGADIPEDIQSMNIADLDISKAVETLFMNWPEKVWMEFVDTLMSKTFIDGKKLADGKWKIHFSGKPGLLMRVVASAAEYQFSDFLKELKDSLPEKMALKLQK